MSQIRITDVDEAEEDKMAGDDILSTLGPLMGGTVRMMRARAAASPTLAAAGDDIEAHLRMMDFFTSPPGSTEDLVGARRAVALEALPDEDVSTIMEEIDRLVEEERVNYMDLPPTDPISLLDLKNEESTGSNQIPKTQLAHGDWYVVVLSCCGRSTLICLSGEGCVYAYSFSYLGVTSTSFLSVPGRSLVH